MSLYIYIITCENNNLAGVLEKKEREREREREKKQTTPLHCIPFTFIRQ